MKRYKTLTMLMAAILNSALAFAAPIRCVTPGMVETVAFSPDGKTVASGGADRMVRIWDAADGKQLHELPIYKADDQAPVVASVAFSPDGKTLAIAGLQSKPVTFWDAASGAKLDQSLEVNHFKQFAWGIAFSPDGASLAATGPGGLEVWDFKTNKPSFVIRVSSRFLPRKLVFSPDGSLLATEAGEIFKSATGTPFWNDDVLTCNALAFSPDGRFLITAGRVGGYGEFQVWEIRTRKSVLRHKEDQTGTFYSMAVSPTGKTIATGGWPDKAINLWDFNTGQRVGKLNGHSDQVDSLSFSPDGKKLASASLDKSVLIWNLETDVTTQAE